MCRCCRSWICMPECTRSWWQSQWWRGGRRRRRSLPEGITPRLWRLSSLPVVEPFRCEVVHAMSRSHTNFVESESLKILEFGCIVVSSRWWDIDFVSSGCYIPSSWSELLQDVWDHVWRSKKAWGEAASLPEFLGYYNQDHWRPHYGPWR